MDVHILNFVLNSDSSLVETALWHPVDWDH